MWLDTDEDEMYDLEEKYEDLPLLQPKHQTQMFSLKFYQTLRDKELVSDMGLSIFTISVFAVNIFAKSIFTANITQLAVRQFCCKRKNNWLTGVHLADLMYLS